MTIKGVGQTAREVFLTVGALLGVLCIVATVAGVAFDVKPLVFRSGSMSPAIHTGDLAVSRTVEASALKAGDIVSVVNSEGNRVTHRLVNAASQGDARQLTLKGDANTVADAEVYTVDKAERVLFHIPKAGYLVNAAASPAGVFTLGVYVTAMLLLVFRGKGPKDGPGESSARRKGGARKAEPKRPRAAARTVAIAVFASGLAFTSPAIGTPWTKVATISGGTYTAHVVATPTGPTCNNRGGALGLLGYVEAGWNNVDSRYRYKAVVIDVGSGATVGAPTYIDNPGAGSATVSSDFTMSLITSSGTKDYDIRIYSTLTGVPAWISAGYTTIAVKTTSILFLGLSLRCR